ncbi:hypothetical protein RHSIM_Rhsim07G0087300 [Rhododendron simsii]|uniref:WRKY domain-containing protein n=1 Tax=Rhododendron simsii TaxID=118357 RepID=A0A834GQ12_RHOSS|nr:hypothetical protein RHSIM_Rhsim07G0087300 [Rhododendron simsii]
MDIDWVSLLTGSTSITNNGDQMPLIMPNVSSVTSGARNTNEGENFGKPKGKGSASRAKKAVPPRVAFHTRSTEDVLDDGYRWRKYGQKAVKNTNHPRNKMKRELLNNYKNPSMFGAIREQASVRPSCTL